MSSYAKSITTDAQGRSPRQHLNFIHHGYSLNNLLSSLSPCGDFLRVRLSLLSPPCSLIWALSPSPPAAMVAGAGWEGVPDLVVSVGFLCSLVGFLVLDWRAVDFLGEICCYLGVLLGEVFRRSELKADVSYSNVDSTDKALVRCFLLICCAAVRFLLLAGLGGEGEEKFDAAADGSGGWWGCPSVPASWRGAGRSWTGPSCLLSRWKEAECAFDAGSLNKRFHLRSGGFCVVFFLLAGLGGEGEEGYSALDAGFGRWRGISAFAVGGCLLRTWRLVWLDEVSSSDRMWVVVLCWGVAKLPSFVPVLKQVRLGAGSGGRERDATLCWCSACPGEFRLLLVGLGRDFVDYIYKVLEHDEGVVLCRLQSWISNFVNYRFSLRPAPVDF